MILSWIGLVYCYCILLPSLTCNLKKIGNKTQRLILIPRGILFLYFLVNLIHAYITTIGFIIFLPIFNSQGNRASFAFMVICRFMVEM